MLRFLLILSLVLAQLAPVLRPVAASTGAPAVSGVSGRVWLDADGDGHEEGGESGLPYVQLCLFADDNPANGQIDPDEGAAACAFSQIDGSYTITDVAPAVYMLAVSADTVLPVYQATTPTTFGPLTLDDGVVVGQDVGLQFHEIRDVNQDCILDIVDIGVVSLALGDRNSPYDFDGDGVVDDDDVLSVAVAWSQREACQFRDGDGDWLPDGYELSQGADPTQADSDGDGLDDYLELRFYHTAVQSSDSDGDGLDDGVEIRTYASDPWQADSDQDGAGDGLEAYTMHTDPTAADSDGDGLPDPAEDGNRDGQLDPAETDPNQPDTDADGLWDGHDVMPGLQALATDTVPMATTIPGELDHGANPRLPDSDGDGLSDGEEVRLGSLPNQADSDNDGLADGEELVAGSDGFITDLLDADSDDDGLEDGAEAMQGCHPLLADADGDKLNDAREVALGTACRNPDSDGDGLSDGDEVDVFGTDPLISDSDGDGMPDRWEVEHGLPGNQANAGADDDGDGLSNLREYQQGTDPGLADTDADLLTDGAEVDQHGTNPLNPDSDDDQARDGDEIAFGTDPLTSDSDGDGLLDGAEPAWAIDVDNDGLICALDTDCDGDGINDGEEVISGNDGVITDPAQADSDDDGMPDAYELAQGFDPTDPADAAGDADSDTISNTLEYALGANPWNADSDADSLPDGFEFAQGLNPADAGDAAGDKDGDGLSNAVEYAHQLPIDDEDADDDGLQDGEELNWSGDSDGDGLIDALDADADNDGLQDGEETFTYGTSPILSDSDGDTLSDGDEVNIHGTDPLSPDSDGDTLRDDEELSAGSDGYVTDPLSRDTDGDHLSDDFEIGHFTDPTDTDTDHDGVNDGNELVLGIDPTDPDSDDDGLDDGAELARGTSPSQADTEGDGVPDGFDLDPLDPDVDGDGRPDGSELTPGWNGAWTQAEDADPGAVQADPAFPGVIVATHGGDSQVAGWSTPLDRSGWYRVLVRARSGVQVGDRMAVQLSTASSVFTETFALMQGLYRWHSTDVFSVTAGSTITVGVQDMQPGTQSVWVDQMLVVRGDDALFFPATLAADPDSDDDGLSDGEEWLRSSLWLEAEHYLGPVSPPATVLDDVQAANSKALTNNQPGQLLMQAAQTTAGLPPGAYQIYARARWNPQAGPRPNLLFRVTTSAQTYDLNLQELSDWYEWQPISTTFQIPADGAFTLQVFAPGQPGAVLLDKLLIAPLAFSIYSVDGGEPALPGPFEGMRPPPGQPWGGTVYGELTVGQPFVPTDPLDMDTDGDGERRFDGIIAASSGWLTDGFELLTLQSNPFSIDTDGDADLYLWDGTQWIFQPDFILDDEGGWDTDADCIPDGAPGAPDGLPDWTDATDCNPLSMDSDDDDLLDPIDPLPADADIDDDGLKDGEEDRNLNGVYDVGAETDLGMNYPGNSAYDCTVNGLLPGWDTDGDGISDGTEAGRILADVTVFTDLACFVPDADPGTRTQPAKTDSDGDGLGDGVEDADHNGARNGSETAAHTPDTDGDGLWDGHNVGTQPGELDTHHPAQTQTTDPLDSDSDDDGLPDGQEVMSARQTNPRDADTDGDGVEDSAEVKADFGYATDPTRADSDGDGLNDAAEMVSGLNGVKTDPLSPDSDHDGLWDGYDVGVHKGELSTHTIGVNGGSRNVGPTDPLNPDSDGDSLSDGDELGASPASDPTARDSDGDGFPDDYEGDSGTDPADASDKPADLLIEGVLLRTDASTTWQRQPDGSMKATGTVILSAFGSGAAGQARSQARPTAHFAAPSLRTLVRHLRPEQSGTRVEIQGQVVVLPDGLTITGSGAFIITLTPAHSVTLASHGSYALDAKSGALTVVGGLDQHVAIGGWDFAQFEVFDSNTQVRIDLATGAVQGRATVKLQMAAGVYHRLTASFVFSPTASLLTLRTQASDDVIPFDIAGIEDYFTLAEAELFIDVTGQSFRGSAKVVDWALGAEFFTGGGPSLDIGWDKPRDRYWFRAKAEASATLQAGGLSLTVSAPAGAKFGFEVGVKQPYFYIEAALDVPPVNEVLSINDVQLEIDPSGAVTLTPDYPVGDILTEPISGHIRFLGDVTVHVPLVPALQAANEDEEQQEAKRTPAEIDLLPSLDIHVAGEMLWRLDLSGGCDQVFAANGTVGLGVSVAVVGLMYDFGGTSMMLTLDGPSMPRCTPDVAALALVQNGIELGNFSSNPILNELGKINLTPEMGVAVEFDIPAGVMTLAGRYEIGPFELDARLRLDAFAQRMTIASTLQTAFLQGGVQLNGQLDFAGNLSLSGHSTVSIAGFDLFQGDFAFSNDVHAAHMLTAQGTLTIPNVGGAQMSGWLDTDGRFRLSGMGVLAPLGFTLASASFTFTEQSLSFNGSLQAPGNIGAVSVSGTASPTAFELKGSAALNLNDFSMTADVILNNSGLFVRGAVDVWGGSQVTMAGAIQTNGDFLLTASGTVVLHGYEFASASFTLEHKGSSVRFDATADLKLGEKTLSEVTVHFGGGGGFSAHIAIQWGFSFSVDLTVAADGSFSFSTAAKNLSLSYSGYGLSGSFSLSVSGSSSMNVSFAATGTARVKLAGATVFAGDIDVSSAGSITVAFSAWGQTIRITFKI